MGSQNRKNTRAGKRRAPNTTERPTKPVERLAVILKLYSDHACPNPSSPLTSGATPLEVVQRSRELAEWLYCQSCTSLQRDRGSQHVFLMLVGALNHLDRELKPLFETAEQITGVRL